jgi:dedicator of cytokinesis protein 3
MPRESSPWEPLPHIIYGYAVHQVVPASRRDVRYSSRTRSSVVSQRSADERFQERDLVPLEVGGER